MIADDHGEIRGILRAILENAPGIELVGQAEDGVEAVTLAAETEPDVVLMDLSMPRMDGLEATRRIRSARPATRVIGLSLSVEEERIAAMYEAGAHAYLVKGVAGATLVKAIRKVDRGIGRRRGLWG